MGAYRKLLQKFNTRILMNASLMWLTAPADKTKRKNFDLHLSPGVRLAEGAVGQHYHASGNFSACKDKKRRGEGEEAWGRGGGGLQLEDIMCTSHPHWKRNDKEEKEETRK